MPIRQLLRHCGIVLIGYIKGTLTDNFNAITANLIGTLALLLKIAITILCGVFAQPWLKQAPDGRKRGEQEKVGLGREMKDILREGERDPEKVKLWRE